MTESNSINDKFTHDKAILAACKAQYAAKQAVLSSIPSQDELHSGCKAAQDRSESARLLIADAKQLAILYDAQEADIEARSRVIEEERQALNTKRSILRGKEDDAHDNLTRAKGEYSELSHQISVYHDVCAEANELQHVVEELERQATQAAGKHPIHILREPTGMTHESIRVETALVSRNKSDAERPIGRYRDDPQISRSNVSTTIALNVHTHDPQTQSQSRTMRRNSISRIESLTTADLDAQKDVKLEQIITDATLEKVGARKKHQKAMWKARQPVKNSNPDFHRLPLEEQARQFEAAENAAQKKRAAQGIDIVTTIKKIEDFVSQEKNRIQDEFRIKRESFATTDAPVTPSTDHREVDLLWSRSREIISRAQNEANLGVVSPSTFLAACRKRSSSVAGTLVGDDDEEKGSTSLLASGSSGDSARRSPRKKQKKDYSLSRYYMQKGV